MARKRLGSTHIANDTAKKPQSKKLQSNIASKMGHPKSVSVEFDDDDDDDFESFIVNDCDPLWKNPSRYIHIEEDCYSGDLVCSKERSRLLHFRSAALGTAMPEGCGVAKLSVEDFLVLKTMEKRIVEKFGETGMITWGSSLEDQRRRGYCFLSSSKNWSNVQDLVSKNVLLHDEGEDTDPNRSVRKLAEAKHKHAVENSCVHIDPTEEETNAIYHVIEKMKEIVSVFADKLAPYERDAISLDNLIAIQPNLHGKIDHLPLHLDSPLHDGFGIVIATVCIIGEADIVIVDEGDSADGSDIQSWAFPLKPGELYLLSGYSRNKCSHGVIRSQNDRNATFDRISLNFRFGLHTPQQVRDDIDRFWK